MRSTNPLVPLPIQVLLRYNSLSFPYTDIIVFSSMVCVSNVHLMISAFQNILLQICPIHLQIQFGLEVVGGLLNFSSIFESFSSLYFLYNNLPFLYYMSPFCLLFATPEIPDVDVI